MLGLAEYSAGAARLLRTARAHEARTKTYISHLNSGPFAPYKHKLAASNIGKHVASDYYDRFRTILHDTMHDVSHNAVHHYTSQLKKPHDHELVEHLVDKQYKENYYGATLNQRLRFNEAQLMSNTYKSALVAPEHVAATLTHSYPFGAQVNIDKRVMLSTSSKIENDAARLVATNNEEVKLIKWTLSDRHVGEDDCDLLANNVSPDVDKYMADNSIDVDPAGVYFAEDLPHPPHPNCQCEYELITAKGIATTTKVQRALNTIQSLLRKLRGK